MIKKGFKWKLIDMLAALKQRDWYISSASTHAQPYINRVLSLIPRSSTPFVHLIDCVTNHNARGLYSGFQRDKTKCINFKRWWLSNLNNVIKIYNVTILNHLFSIFSVLAIHSYIYYSVITFLTYRKRYYKTEGVVGPQKWSDRNTCIFS